MSEKNSSRGAYGSQGWYSNHKYKLKQKIKLRGAATSAIGPHDPEQKNNHNDKIRPPTAAPVSHRDRAHSLKVKTEGSHYTSSLGRHDDLGNTSIKLKTQNFKHHDPNMCVCSECDCGRHFCRFHSIKPDLTKKTVYKKDFKKQKMIKNKVNISTEYQRYTGPNLNKQTTYLSDFSQQEGDEVKKNKPQDLLTSTGAPFQYLTSYTSGFPGHHGQNQYVKPKDQYTRGYFPLRSQSTYSRQFVRSETKKNERHKIPDSLKLKSNWFGSTTYANTFKKPNPQNYSARKQTKTEIYEVPPNDKHQFETIYKKSFKKQGPKVCPAKISLETRAKGQYKQSKDKFSENTDFKALSPNFQAIATSKNYYV